MRFSSARIIVSLMQASAVRGGRFRSNSVPGSRTRSKRGLPGTSMLPPSVTSTSGRSAATRRLTSCGSESSHTTAPGCRSSGSIDVLRRARRGEHELRPPHRAAKIGRVLRSDTPARRRGLGVKLAQARLVAGDQKITRRRCGAMSRTQAAPIEPVAPMTDGGRRRRVDLHFARTAKQALPRRRRSSASCRSSRESASAR